MVYCQQHCPPEGELYLHAHTHALKDYSVQKSLEGSKMPKSTPINIWHCKFSDYTLRYRHVDFQSANVKYGKYTKYSGANQIQALHYAFRFYLRPSRALDALKKSVWNPRITFTEHFIERFRIFKNVYTSAKCRRRARNTTLLPSWAFYLALWTQEVKQ